MGINGGVTSIGIMEWWDLGITGEYPVGRAVGSTAGRRPAVPPIAEIGIFQHYNIPLLHRSSLTLLGRRYSDCWLDSHIWHLLCLLQSYEDNHQSQFPYN